MQNDVHNWKPAFYTIKYYVMIIGIIMMIFNLFK